MLETAYQLAHTRTDTSPHLIQHTDNSTPNNQPHWDILIFNQIEWDECAKSCQPICVFISPLLLLLRLMMAYR